MGRRQARPFGGSARSQLRRANSRARWSGLRRRSSMASEGTVCVGSARRFFQRVSEGVDAAEDRGAPLAVVAGEIALVPALLIFGVLAVALVHFRVVPIGALLGRTLEPGRAALVIALLEGGADVGRWGARVRLIVPPAGAEQRHAGAEQDSEPTEASASHRGSLAIRPPFPRGSIELKAIARR